MRRAATFCRAVLLAGIAFTQVAAQAHDSWLVPGGDQFVLATGTRYPQIEVAPPPESVAASACVGGDGRRIALQARKADARGLSLVAGAPAAALGCWVELREAEIVLPEQLIPVYLREVQPTEATRLRWQSLQAQGAPWHERYRKFARAEVARADANAQQLAAIRRPAGLPLEIVPLGDAPLRAGSAARFTVLASGEPVPGLAVQLVSDRSPLGVWSRTDAHGEVQWPLPFAGGWIVRSIALDPDRESGWTSRFATLSFQAR